MPRFVYQLESLLSLRERQERDKQLVLAQVESESRDIEARLRAIHSEIARGKQSWRDSLAGAVDPRAARLEAGAAVHAQFRAQRLVLQLAGIQRRIESARADLLEASRRRRAVELHKERRLREWRRAQSRREDQMLDEMAVMAAARTIPDDLQHRGD